MRIRYIKPGLCKNEFLGTGPIEAHLLFAMLPMLADKSGRLEDRPLRIKAELFPYRDLDIDCFLAWLHDNGFILRYEANGVKCLQILKFEQHQKTHHKETASTLPPPNREKVGASTDLGTFEPRGNGNGDGELERVTGNGNGSKASFPSGLLRDEVWNRLKQIEPNFTGHWRAPESGTGFADPEKVKETKAEIDTLAELLGVERVAQVLATVSGPSMAVRLSRAARDIDEAKKAARRASPVREIAKQKQISSVKLREIK